MSLFAILLATPGVFGGSLPNGSQVFAPLLLDVVRITETLCPDRATAPAEKNRAFQYSFLFSPLVVTLRAYKIRISHGVVETAANGDGSDRQVDHVKAIGEATDHPSSRDDDRAYEGMDMPMIVVPYTPTFPTSSVLAGILRGGGRERQLPPACQKR